MSYSQTIVLKKTGSDWDFVSEVLEELHIDINDSNYINFVRNNSLFAEEVQLDDGSQELTIKRTFANESDYNTFKTNLSDSYTDPASNLQSKGWTITQTLE